jgi:two-component system cell cycle sensor histidine kinase/response regulator CckA
MKTKQNFARIITQLSALIILLLMIIPPLGYFFISYQHVVGSLETEGRISAITIMKIISLDPHAWEFEEERLQDVLSSYPRKGYIEKWRTLNAKNEVIAESPIEIEKPSITRSFDLMDSGVIVGRLEISRSIKPLLIKDSMVELFMLPIGIGAFLALYFLPIRTIHRAENALMKSKELLEKTFASLHDAIFIVDAQTEKIIDCNPTATKIFGYKREEIMDQTIDFLYMSENENKNFNDYLNSATEKKGSLFIRDMRMKRKDETIFPAEYSALPLEDDKGRIMGWVNVVRDITDQNKIEEELIRAEKLESLGILAGGIAHDFNNLMIGILGNISLIKSFMVRQDEAYGIVEDIEKAALKTRDLTRQLLTFSKGGYPVKKIASMAAIMRESVRFALSGSNVKCQFSIPDDLWAVNVDEGQIGQAISNIIINAIQAMPGGGIIEIGSENLTIAENNVIRCVGCSDRCMENRVYCPPQESCPALCRIVSQTESGVSLGEGKHVRISVKDHGIGIAKEYLPKIFDPYFTSKQGGSGLGLATVYSVVKRHGGHIDVESEIGFGTTFHIYLPATREKFTHAMTQEKIPLRGKGKILVMDDREVVRNAVKRMLSSIGYDVVLAREGSDAIAMYKKALQSGKPFDAVILDLTVPGGMGGKEAAKKVLEIDPNAKVIVSSGYSNDPVMSEFKKYGFVGLLEKPYRMQKLRDTLLKVIETRSGY